MRDLQYFNDWHAIVEGKARYCRLLDMKDWNGLADLCTDDFTLEFEHEGQMTVAKGREAAMKSMRASMNTAVTVHHVHSPEIQINGDEARVVWAMQDRVIWGSDRHSIIGYGHYHERWVKQKGEWKVASVRLTRLHVDFVPPSGSPAI